MYRIVNKTIEDLVVEQFGENASQRMKQHSGVEAAYYISNEPYYDEITFKLAEAVASEMGIALTDVLIAFCEYWVLKTGKEEYGYLMTADGSSLRAFYKRIQLIYLKLMPPEFKVSAVEANSLQLDYYSNRQGLQAFVIGPLQGLGEMFATDVHTELLQHRSRSRL